LRYEIVTVSYYDYSSHADVGFFDLTDGTRMSISPAGHSFKEFVGKSVLLKLRPEGSGFRLEGIAEVLNPGKPEKNGRLVDFRTFKFGRSITNRGYSWSPPGEEDTVIESRNK